ncbi:Condensin-2 complex subunit G2, partial [Perkinsus olseni]
MMVNTWPKAFPFPPECFDKLDGAPDADFYEVPKLDMHISEQMAECLKTKWYGDLLPMGRDTHLELGAGVRSYFPESYTPSTVIGYGMNMAEMEGNDVLTERHVQDLNINPYLPYQANVFDCITLAFSIQYLTQPHPVLSEAHRLLRPGGVLIISYTDRCFETKVTDLWYRSSMLQRALLCRGYLHYSGAAGCWSELTASGSYLDDDEPLIVMWARNQQAVYMPPRRRRQPPRRAAKRAASDPPEDDDSAAPATAEAASSSSSSSSSTAAAGGGEGAPATRGGAPKPLVDGQNHALLQHHHNTDEDEVDVVDEDQTPLQIAKDILIELDKCLLETATLTDVKRVYKLRHHLKNIRWELADTADVRDEEPAEQEEVLVVNQLYKKLERCICRRIFHRNDNGIAFVASVLTMHPAFIVDAFAAIKLFIPQLTAPVLQGLSK